MFQWSTDDSLGLLHLTVLGSSTLEDFQESMPDIISAFRSGKHSKLLLQVKNLNESDNYIDPDLEFWVINQIKVWVTKMAIVCPNDLRPAVEQVAEVVRNHNKPVKIFNDLQDALRWLK